jgi:multiple sugar transport system ATP-binding protein
VLETTRPAEPEGNDVAQVEFDHVTKRFPDGTVAVDELSLHIDDGEFVILVGPSGCGKSTALRMVAGLEEISDGKLTIGDRVVNDLTPKERDIAMVFQSYALYPHMSVADNMGFALKLAKVDKAEIDRRVKDAADILDLTDYLDRKPRALSGGQRQRVAMGRAIVRSPQAFLMDEPLSNLDAKLRVQMRAEIMQLQNRLGVTTIYVTHDQVEAMTMGDRVAVLKDGLLQQCDTPIGLFGKPKNLFVAGFIGSPAMNLIPATVGAEGAVIGGKPIELTAEQRSALTGNNVVVGVRPEGWTLKPAGEGITAMVEVVEELGSDQFLYCSTTATELTSAEGEVSEIEAHTITVRAPGMSAFTRGEKVGLVPQTGAVHLFDADTGARLPD